MFATGGDVGEDLERLLGRQREDVGDRLALVVDLERLAVVALAAADVAGHVDVGQEVHLDLDLPVARARLAAAALDVEGEAARLVAARPRLRRPRHELADRVEDVRVGRRVRARRAADRRLVDVDDLVDLEEPLDLVVRARLLRRAVERAGERPVEDVVDERRLSRARDARHRRHHAEREAARRCPAGCARARRGRRSPCPMPVRRRSRDRDRRARPRGTSPSATPGNRSSSSGEPSRDDPAAVDARRPGPRSMTQSAERIVSSSCSTTMTVLPRSRIEMQRVDQLAVVALVQADRRLVEHVEHAHELRADLRREPDALRLAARERRRAAREVEVPDADVGEEARAGRWISLRILPAISLSRGDSCRSSKNAIDVGDRLGGDLVDRAAAHLHRERLRLQPPAVAAPGRARRTCRPRAPSAARGSPSPGSAARASARAPRRRSASGTRPSRRRRRT